MQGEVGSLTVGRETKMKDAKRPVGVVVLRFVRAVPLGVGEAVPKAVIKPMEVWGGVPQVAHLGAGVRVGAGVGRKPEKPEEGV